MKPQRVENSYKTVIFIAAFTAALALLWQIRSILLLFFVCFILMEIINPLVSRLEKLKVSRPLAIIIIYILSLTVVIIALAGIIPVLVEQTPGLISNLPHIFKGINIFGFKLNMINWASQLTLLENLPSEIAGFAISLFSNIFSAVIVLVVTFYLLLERQHISAYSFQIFGDKGKTQAIKIMDTLENRLGHWVGAELILMTIIGVLSYIGYVILGLNYAAPLAIIAALMEIVPNIGPIVTTLIAALVGLTMSPLTGLLTLIWGIIVHQAENNFITPKVMKETIGLNPIITIFTIAVGAKLAGIGGALLAVPVYLILETCIRVLFVKSK